MPRRKFKISDPFLLAVVACFALISSIFLPWGFTQDTSKVSGDALLNLSARLAAVATGKGLQIDASMRLTSLKIPAWIFCVAGAVGAFLVATKKRKLLMVPRKVCLITTGAALLFSISLLFFLLNGGIQVGFLLLATGSGLGFLVSCKHA